MAVPYDYNTNHMTFLIFLLLSKDSPFLNLIYVASTARSQLSALQGSQTLRPGAHGTGPAGTLSLLAKSWVVT